MFQRISGYLRGMIALGPLPLQPVLGIVLSFAAAEAGMENARFTLDYKPKYAYPKAIPYLCDNPATTTEEPNYSPNYTHTPCSSYTFSCQPVGPGEVYVVIARAGAEGVAAASFGITYNGSSGAGIDPNYVTWTPCANGQSFPNSDGVHGNFPQPGGGLRITWALPEGCQTESIGSYGAHAVIGVFYVYAYSADLLRITPNNNLPGVDPELAIADCAGRSTDLRQLLGPALVNFVMGSVGFGQFGSNPCYECESCPAPGTPCGTPVVPTTWGRLKARFHGNP